MKTLKLKRDGSVIRPATDEHRTVFGHLVGDYAEASHEDSLPHIRTLAALHGMEVEIVYPEKPGLTFAQAMAELAAGKSVRRPGWIPQDTVAVAKPGCAIRFLAEDIAATDWQIVEPAQSRPEWTAATFTNPAPYGVPLAQPKTIGQWLETLPEEARAKAFANVKDQGKEDTLEAARDSLRESLVAAFQWSRSYEGRNYWRSIYDEQK